MAQLCLSFCRTDCAFSPDEKIIVTGTSVRKDQVEYDFASLPLYRHLYIVHNLCHVLFVFCVVQGKGELVFFDRELNKVNSLPVADCVSSFTSPPLVSLLFRLLCLLSLFVSPFLPFLFIFSLSLSLSRLNLDFSYPSLSSLAFHLFPSKVFSSLCLPLFST